MQRAVDAMHENGMFRPIGRERPAIREGMDGWELKGNIDEFEWHAHLVFARPADSRGMVSKQIAKKQVCATQRGGSHFVIQHSRRSAACS